jgi:hypothetical protein
MACAGLAKDVIHMFIHISSTKTISSGRDGRKVMPVSINHSLYLVNSDSCLWWVNRMKCDVMLSKLHSAY